MWKALCLTVLIVVSGISTVRSQTIDCVLRPAAVTEFENNKWQSVKVQGLKPLLLTFSDFDFKNAKAKMIGNASSVDVILFQTDKQIDLLEITGSGNKMLTMIFPKTDGTFLGVHSRHTVVVDPLPSQYVGECKLR